MGDGTRGLARGSLYQCTFRDGTVEALTKHSSPLDYHLPTSAAALVFDQPQSRPPKDTTSHDRTMTPRLTDQTHDEPCAAWSRLRHVYGGSAIDLRGEVPVRAKCQPLNTAGYELRRLRCCLSSRVGVSLVPLTWVRREGRGEASIPQFHVTGIPFLALLPLAAVGSPNAMPTSPLVRTSPDTSTAKTTGSSACDPLLDEDRSSNRVLDPRSLPPRRHGALMASRPSASWANP